MITSAGARTRRYITDRRIMDSTAINKVSGLRHPPTGGGPSAVLSVAESCVADHLATHEVVTGIGGGFDSDDLEQIFRASKPASMIMADEPTSEATIPRTSGVIHF
ncbi:uncharacterized protein LOC128235727 [Mya arenaria]|uniref:uncharacterized protein LOC128235727 n=1 Tax=Mya arenaria TaxID=6604 RepID=UPI0022DF0D2F|nr:uncharacterized protein LOC128235727 [Mya arenaria]